MSFVSTKCPNCGANIKADVESKKGVCEFCGAEYITQDVINNYQINNNYSTVQYVTKNVASGGSLESEEYIKNGDVFLSLNMYDKAKKAYMTAIELNPADWRGWFGMVKICTKNFTDYADTTHYSYYAKAEKVATAEQKAEMQALYADYKKEREAIEEARRTARERIEEQARQTQHIANENTKGIIKIALALSVSLAVFIILIILAVL